MKRVGGLFDRLCSFENLLQAARRAQRAKRYRPEVLRFNHRLEDALHRLSEELRTGEWRPGRHRHFRIREPKVRWISAAPYADRVVHHALCAVMGPVLDRRLIHDCWANRSGKGSHRAVLRYQRFAGRSAYALKVDLRKYFPSIDHLILKNQLRRVFKDRRLLAVMERIIDCGVVPEPHHAYFPGDDLFTPFERPKGLPIGNLTSQLWANSYLCGFDHWVTRRLRTRGYLRYVDDFILLGDDPGRLRSWLVEVHAQLAALRLEVHPKKCQVRRTDEGVPFLGHVIWPNRIRVRGQTVRRFRRRYRRKSRADPLAAQASLAAWRGHTRLAGRWRRAGLG